MNDDFAGEIISKHIVLGKEEFEKLVTGKQVCEDMVTIILSDIGFHNMIKVIEKAKATIDEELELHDNREGYKARFYNGFFITYKPDNNKWLFVIHRRAENDKNYLISSNIIGTEAEMLMIAKGNIDTLIKLNQ